MTRDDAAPLPGDLLLQAVEGMERPLFVLDEDWRFRYVNPAGAALLGETVDALVGRVIWEKYPETVDSPFEVNYRRVAETGEPASFEAWYAPLQIWFQVDAFRTDGGLVVTYDDVTERRRIEEERAAAVAAREAAAAEAAVAAAEAEEAGRHLMLLGDINLAMTSTFDTDEAVDRFAHLVVPLLADWCLVSVVDPDGTRRDVGRAHRDPALVDAMHRYADLRVASNLPTAPVPKLLPGPPTGRHSRLHRRAPDGDGGQPRGRAALEPLRPAAVAAFPLVARGEVFGALTLVNGPERGPHTAAELRTAEIASRRAALALDNARLATRQPAGGRAAAAEPALPARAARPPRARGPVPAGDPGRLDRRRLVRRLPAARRRHRAGHRRRHGARHRGRRGDGPGQDAGPGHRLRPGGGARPRCCAGSTTRWSGWRCRRWRRRWSAGSSRTTRTGGGGAAAALVVGRPPGSDAAARRRHGRRPGGAGRPAAGHRLARPPRRRAGHPAPGQHPAAVHRRPVRAARDPARRRPRPGARDPQPVGRPPLEALCDRLLAEMLGEGVEDDVAVLAVRAHPVHVARPVEAGPEILPPALPPCLTPRLRRG